MGREFFDTFHSFPGTIGHVAHGKSTVVKAISGVHVSICQNILSICKKTPLDGKSQVHRKVLEFYKS